jgi:acyl carrier protein
VDQLRTEIRAFVIENFMFGDGGDPLGNAESLLDRGVIDSTGVLELVGFLERRFGIAVEDEELDPRNLDTIDALVQYVSRKQASNGNRLAS